MYKCYADNSKSSDSITATNNAF